MPPTLTEILDLLNSRFDKLETQSTQTIDAVNQWGHRIVRLEQWQEDHVGNRHAHIEQALERLSSKQESQGEKLYHLASEVAKWGVLILLLVNIVIQLWQR